MVEWAAILVFRVYAQKNSSVILILRNQAQLTVRETLGKRPRDYRCLTLAYSMATSKFSWLELRVLVDGDDQVAAFRRVDDYAGIFPYPPVNPQQNLRVSK